MIRRCVLHLVLVASASVFIAEVPAAQQVSLPLAEPAKRAVVEAAAKMLRERYILPDVGAQAAQAIESALRGGAYDGLDEPGAFAQRLTTVINRNPGTEAFRSQEFWSESTPFSYVGKPVLILTSERTFSGGEGFAYHMQVMKLATVVGETTGGGANPGGTVRLAAGLTMFVPGGRARSPITGTNWEGVGVKPDIAVPGENALKAALEQLGVSPAGIEIDAPSRSHVFDPRNP